MKESGKERKSRKQKTFPIYSNKIDILDPDHSLEIFESPKKDKPEQYSSPKRNKVRKSFVEKMKEYGY